MSSDDESQRSRNDSQSSTDSFVHVENVSEDEEGAQPHEAPAGEVQDVDESGSSANEAEEVASVSSLNSDDDGEAVNMDSTTSVRSEDIEDEFEDEYEGEFEEEDDVQSNFNAELREQFEKMRADLDMMAADNAREKKEHEKTKKTMERLEMEAERNKLSAQANSTQQQVVPAKPIEWLVALSLIGVIGVGLLMVSASRRKSILFLQGLMYNIARLRSLEKSNIEFDNDIGDLKYQQHRTSVTHNHLAKIYDERKTESQKLSEDMTALKDSWEQRMKDLEVTGDIVATVKDMEKWRKEIDHFVVNLSQDVNQLMSYHAMLKEMKDEVEQRKAERVAEEERKKKENEKIEEEEKVEAVTPAPPSKPSRVLRMTISCIDKITSAMNNVRSKVREGVSSVSSSTANAIQKVWNAVPSFKPPTIRMPNMTLSDFVFTHRLTSADNSTYNPALCFARLPFVPEGRKLCFYIKSIKLDC